MRVEPFALKTLPDVLNIVRSRFTDEAEDQARQILSNPALEEGESAGDLVYRDTTLEAFQATVVRNVYFAGEKIRASFGGMLCKRADDSPVEAVMEVLRRTGGASYGSRIFFGNTASPVSARLNKVGGCKAGPESWSRYRLWIPHWWRFLAYAIRRKIFRLQPPRRKPFALSAKEWDCVTEGIRVSRRLSIDAKAFDEFWRRKLSETKGLISSRTAEELEWLFGGKLKTGRAVLLCVERPDVVGYVVIGDDAAASQWSVLDLVAENNDIEIMRALLNAAKRFLRERTPAMTFSIIGFPDFMQPMIEEETTFTRKRPNNCFVWKFNDRELAKRVVPEANTERSWFFGPYDGDMCMCG